MPSHSWEQQEHSWDNWNADSDDDVRSEEEKATAAFLEVLLGLYFMSSLTAQNFCVLCYWAHKARMTGIIGEYAYPPGRSSGKYQEHLDEKLHFKSERKKTYQFRTPGTISGEGSRGEITLVSMPGHETVQHECDDPIFRTKLREAIDQGTLPPSYDDHPVVTSHHWLHHLLYTWTLFHILWWTL